MVPRSSPPAPGLRPRARARPPAAPPGEVVPFDYAATFRLEGEAGRLHQAVINIGPDAGFVATAIGYGFDEARRRDLQLLTIPPANEPPVLGPLVPLKHLPAEALLSGFRFNPVLRRVQPAFAGKLEQLKTPEDISFLFSMVDTSTGRELQDEPTHNLASLGKSNGERPFRKLARPLFLGPRSSLRLQVIERTEGVRGELTIVLYGCHIYAPTGCPPGAGPRLPSPPEARVIPFDYVATFAMTGVPDNRLEGEILLNSDGEFVATSIGYGLAVEERGIDLDEGFLKGLSLATIQTIFPNAVQTPAGVDLGDIVNLAELPLGGFSLDALEDGIRLRPELARLAFLDNGNLATALPIALLRGTTPGGGLFERLNRPQDVAFRYAIFDTGRGRELQSGPLFNVAGLGIADGDRPFKQLACPLRFPERSTIRIHVEEIFGRGTLFLVFQGYKRFGARTGGR